MFTQSSQIGEQWSHIRDHQNRGVSEADNRELFHITQVEFQPPSKAHKKRLTRARLAVTVKSRVQPKPEDRQKLAHNSRRCLALNILAINSPNSAAIKRHGHTDEEASTPEWRRVKAHVHKPVESDAPKADVPWNRKPAMRSHLLACRKSNVALSLDRLCDVFAIFGNYAAFEGAE